VPELAEIVWFLIVKIVFESGIAVSELLKEFVLRAHRIEVERFAGGEDDDLLGEVAVIGVIQAVCTSISLVLPYMRSL
jgi:hypothetical protein